jgi:small subunit ribosomal protein S15
MGAYFNMLTKRQKKLAIGTAARHDEDTGSPEVQISILTRKIEDLSAHLKKNHKDRHSRRGLLKMVADRRSHMKYLEEHDTKAYNAVAKKLGLKK